LSVSQCANLVYSVISAFEFNRVVRRSFARRCAKNFGYILESFPTVRRFEEGEEPEEEN